MDPILTLARDLGKKIGEHAVTRAYTDAARGVSGDREAEQLIHDFQVQAEKVGRLTATGGAIEVADKHKLSELEMKVATHGKLKSLMKAQADYMQLMQQVQGAIDEGTQSTAGPAGAA